MNARLPERTHEQIDWLVERSGMTKSQVLVLAIDRLWSDEVVIAANEELNRLLADIFISVANGRAAVSKIVGGAIERASNWQDLEEDARAAIEAQGGFITLSGIYECPRRLAEQLIAEDCPGEGYDANLQQ